MFYELNTFDPFGTTPWKRSPGSELQGTFGGDLDIMAPITLLLDPDATFVHEGAIQPDDTPAVAQAGVVNNAQLSDIEIPNILPDG